MILSSRILSNRVLSNRILSSRILSSRILSSRILSNGILSSRILSSRILSNRNYPAGYYPAGWTNPFCVFSDTLSKIIVQFVRWVLWGNSLFGSFRFLSSEEDKIEPHFWPTNFYWLKDFPWSPSWSRNSEGHLTSDEGPGAGLNRKPKDSLCCGKF